MRPLRPGQETVLSWTAGAVECRVVASAGAYVLLQLGTAGHATGAPAGRGSLTYLDGMTPMGWDGVVEPGSHLGEVRFHLDGSAADRRAAVRLPAGAELSLHAGGLLQSGRLIDVSAGGLRFRHGGELRRGEHVHVRLELPGGPLVEADAVVRVTEPGLSSVEFTALHAASAQDIGVWTVTQLRAALSGVG